MRPEPTRIEPIFSPRIWGARSLAPLFPEKSNLTEPLGEAWLTGVDCKIASGPFAGKTLGAAWREMPVEWRGTRLASTTDFPILVKFIFPNDKLSIQVHPDDAYASVHEKAAGGRGKTEMWHAVSAEPGAQVLVGLKPGVTKEMFLEALAAHTLEDFFEAYSVRAGDTFFVPAGTPHTIGPGMVLCEVQQYSDLTYRVYDYGRVDTSGKPRELHVQKALDVISFDRRVGRGMVTQVRRFQGNISWEKLVDCPYFSTWRFETGARTHLAQPWNREHFALWVFLKGKGVVGWTSTRDSVLGEQSFGEFRYKQGECWFLPAGFGSHTFHPQEQTSLLMACPGSPISD